MNFKTYVLIIALLHSLSSCATTKELKMEKLKSKLEKIHIQYDLPSLAVVATNSDSVLHMDLIGRRDIDQDISVSIDDKYHLGSNTKSMTSMLTAILVEKGYFTWETKIKDVLKDLNIHKDYKDVTIEQLLRHRGGFTNSIPNSNIELWKEFVELQKESKSFEQRKLLKETLLQEKPFIKPDTKSVYSNECIAIAGHLIEVILKGTFEDIMNKYIFENLNMKMCGFGTPGKADIIDQPRGHLLYNGKIMAIAPGPLSDNPDAIAPAGKVHCSISDWGKYLREHLRGTRNESSVLSSSSYKMLHHPLFKDNFGLGWLKIKADFFNGKEVLFHNGSNTMNYDEMWIFPEDNFAIGAVTNIGNESAMKAIRETITEFTQEFVISNN